MNKDNLILFQEIQYHQRLGVELEDIDNEKVKLHLPFKEENANLGSALHGGIAASLINIAARQLVIADIEDNQDKFDIKVLHQDVQYLSAAISEPIEAVGTILRRGKELFFICVDVLKGQSVFVARGMVTVRRVLKSTKGNESDPPSLKKETFFPGPYDPGQMAGFLTSQGFIGDLGMKVEHMKNGIAIIKMPFKEKLSDNKGQFHDGALAALTDTTGAMSAWATVPFGMHKASTPAIHINFLSPSQGENVYALAKMFWQREEIFFSNVHIVGEKSGKVFLQGTVVYRIVINKPNID